MNCANCGDEVGNIQKIFCIDCAKESRLTWHRNYQREYKRINKEKYRVLQ
jgi:predicted amidophosphoribosyltransferase